MKWSEILFVLLLTIPGNVFTKRCSRYPSNTFTPKSPVDENFVISITGNAQTYILGQSYNVSLHAYNGHRFISAKLVLENENGEKSFNEDLGRLDVVDPVESRYSQNCINMIETTNTNPKTKLEAVWVAPAEPGNGCVLIRATVLQHRDVWFMDDGGLTKRICEEIVDDVESQKMDLEEKRCCACDEARFEITFEGLWSRNLHPKDFPTRGWLTKFSDIVGAAHTSDYRFWDMGVLASTEMQEFAEHGSMRGLEREFDQYFKQGKIRTIIRARGPAFPYLNSPSVASIRVDPKHHQLSIASKITPSPDWIVGVAGLELCLSNCTWLEDKVINLYPWDIGTDAGPSYTSPDQPQLPPDVIRRMRSDFPPDPRSPFFDESGTPMKPLATLHIKRQRLYERKCPDDESNNIQDIPRECFTHPWSDWSDCSAQCGEGRQYRHRVYKQPDVARIYNCDIMIVNRQERPCRGERCSSLQNLLNNNNNYGPMSWQGENEEDAFEERLPQMQMKSAKTKAECLVGPWSNWSPCNVTCGEGKMTRTREYVNRYNEEECQETFFLTLNEYRKCFGRQCMGHISNTEVADNEYTEENIDNLPEENIGNQFGTIPNYNTNYRQQQSGGNNERNQKQYGNTRYRQPLTNLYENPDRSQQYVVRVGDPKIREFNEIENVPEPEYNFESESLSVIPEGNLNRLQARRPLKQRNNYQTEEDFETIKPSYQKSDGSSDSSSNIMPMMNSYDKMQGYAKYGDRVLNKAPEYCYQPLNVVHHCADPRIVGNFWFYNYCTDECMLYAADICDRNRNKFLSLEQCEEHCAGPMRNLERFLQQKQAHGCRGGQPNERYFKKRKDNNF